MFNPIHPPCRASSSAPKSPPTSPRHLPSPWPPATVSIVFQMRPPWPASSTSKWNRNHKLRPAERLACRPRLRRPCPAMISMQPTVPTSTVSSSNCWWCLPAAVARRRRTATAAVRPVRHRWVAAAAEVVAVVRRRRLRRRSALVMWAAVRGNRFIRR